MNLINYQDTFYILRIRFYLRSIITNVSFIVWREKKPVETKRAGRVKSEKGADDCCNPCVLLQLPFNRLNNCAPYTRAEIIVFCIIRMTLVRRKKYRCDDGPIEKKWSKPARNRVTQLFTNKTALHWDKLRRTSKIMQPWIPSWMPSFAPPLIKPDRKKCWVRASLFLWLLLICLLLLRLNFRIVIRLRIYCIKGDIKLCIQILIQSLRIKYFLEKINTLIRLKY